MFHIVLVEPEIPQNTGNISRTCAITGTVLHLVRPLGFSLEDRYLKRAGLDYWQYLDVRYYDAFEEVEAAFPDGRFFLASTRTKRCYAEVSYRDGDIFVFGKETAGLPASLLARRPNDGIRIPMLPQQRSLNLSNSAAIVLYEALRQTGFAGLV